MPVQALPIPTPEMIRGTFDMMLREWGHRGTALRLTCRDLGLLPDVVLDAVAFREDKPDWSRSH